LSALLLLLLLFNYSVKTDLICASESWTITQRMTHRLHVFINKCLRRILDIRRKDRVAIKNYWGNRSWANAGPNAKKKWYWLGQTLRGNDDSITKQALQWTPQGLRRRGRPRNTWRRDLEKEMWTAGYKYSWRKMEAAAQDRAGWRQVVCGLCSTMSDKEWVSQVTLGSVSIITFLPAIGATYTMVQHFYYVKVVWVVSWYFCCRKAPYSVS